jgi:hypothetical protein
MKKIALSLAAAGLMLAAGSPLTLTGTITDSMCGGDHSGMNIHPDLKCITECVKSMGAKYALWDGKTVYELSDQKGASKYAAQRVNVSGVVDAATKSIRVVSISRAK